MARIRPRSLLVVLAHPEDEIFHGRVLAHLSSQGVRVTLACATSGEAGTPHPAIGISIGSLFAVDERADRARRSD